MENPFGFGGDTWRWRSEEHAQVSIIALARQTETVTPTTRPPASTDVPFPIGMPIAPMLAKSVTAIPAADSVDGGLAYEPKWDGFRCLVQRDGDTIELGSRGAKPLTRYFPELVESFARILPERVLLDGEILVRSGQPGAQRLDFDALGQRIHPADSRVRLLAEQTPAEFVAFDLLVLGDADLSGLDFADRRQQLDVLFADRTADWPMHLTSITHDHALAQRWLDEFEGAGLDGVVAKPLAQPYQPGKRGWFKVKHERTADVVLLGYRVHKSGSGVGSLLVGLYTDDGRLLNVGGVSSFTAARRLELIDELEPLVLTNADGERVRGVTEKSRFSGGKDASYVALRPERVLEVGYNQMEAWRFRHPATFVRWRPDRDPESCRFDQVDRPIAYDLGRVLT